MTTQLIFLPGASGSTQFWQPLIHYLGSNDISKIIAYPGFGCEPAQDTITDFDTLTEYVLAQIDTPSIIIAQSMGGIFAVQAALEKAEMVKGLVLIATSGGLDLSGFDVEDWRSAYQEHYLNYPDWFVHTRINHEHRLHDIQQPVLLIWGDQDRISPVSVGVHLQHLFPAANLLVVPEGDHALAEQQASKIARPILQFIKQLD